MKYTDELKKKNNIMSSRKCVIVKAKCGTGRGRNDCSGTGCSNGGLALLGLLDFDRFLLVFDIIIQSPIVSHSQILLP